MKQHPELYERTKVIKAAEGNRGKIMALYAQSLDECRARRLNILRDLRKTLVDKIAKLDVVIGEVEDNQEIKVFPSFKIDTDREGIETHIPREPFNFLQEFDDKLMALKDSDNEFVELDTTDYKLFFLAKPRKF